MHEVKNVREREAMLLGERNIQPVVGSGGLQFEIERAAESLAQREAPRLVDAATEWSVNHKLHPAAFVEETLCDHRSLAGHSAEHRAARDDVFNELLRAGGIEPALLLQPVHRGDELRMFLLRSARRNVRSHLAHAFAQ